MRAPDETLQQDKAVTQSRVGGSDCHMATADPLDYQALLIVGSAYSSVHNKRVKGKQHRARCGREGQPSRDWFLLVSFVYIVVGPTHHGEDDNHKKYL